MGVNELNPNHPITGALRDQWHKIAAILIAMHGESVITPEDIAMTQDKYLVAKGEGDQLRLYLVDVDEAERLARG